MPDLYTYPPEFTALLGSYHQEILGIMDQVRWDQEAKKVIVRYSLAAGLLTGSGTSLAPALKQTVLQMAGIASLAACMGELTPDLKERVRGIGQAAIEMIGAELKDAETYTRQLTNNVHALYSRAMSRHAFFRDTGKIIETQLNEAWLSGADEMMVLPEDMTPEDKAYIQKLIKDERNFLDGFADDIQDAAGDQAGWQKFQPRISMWVNRLNDVENQARIYFGGKQRLIWKYGPTEHCESCRALNGIVAFAQEWMESGVHPQSRDLKCHGVNCQCTCTPTRQRRTNKALDRIRSIMGQGSSKSFPGHAGIPGHLGGSAPRGGGVGLSTEGLSKSGLKELDSFKGGKAVLLEDGRIIRADDGNFNSHTQIYARMVNAEPDYYSPGIRERANKAIESKLEEDGFLEGEVQNTTLSISLEHDFMGGLTVKTNSQGKIATSEEFNRTFRKAKRGINSGKISMGKANTLSIHVGSSHANITNDEIDTIAGFSIDEKFGKVSAHYKSRQIV